MVYSDIHGHFNMELILFFVIQFAEKSPFLKLKTIKDIRYIHYYAYILICTTVGKSYILQRKKLAGKASLAVSLCDCHVTVM